MEIVDDKKKILIEAFKELEKMGYVIVGGQSYIQATSGILCIHPINTGHLVNELSLRLNGSEEDSE
jgi:uncharacterized protein YabN with tetrapyrrole methylase and pyrophosphatase domain|tara:strand:- start:63 stop:260 length:198 start_codon:yes stop_codon:yes gene_type:complete